MSDDDYDCYLNSMMHSITLEYDFTYSAYHEYYDDIVVRTENDNNTISRVTNHYSYEDSRLTVYEIDIEYHESFEYGTIRYTLKATERYYDNGTESKYGKLLFQWMGDSTESEEVQLKESIIEAGKRVSYYIGDTSIDWDNVHFYIQGERDHSSTWYCNG